MWSDGTVAIEPSPLDLVERLAAIVPPPLNQVRYCGVLAGNAAWRAEVPPSAATQQGAPRAGLLRRIAQIVTSEKPSNITFTILFKPDA